MKTDLYRPGQPVQTIESLSPEPLPNSKHLRIYHLDIEGGFFVNLLYVINGIIFAEENDLIPFVFISNPDLPFYDPIHGQNIWEYYFQPITDIDYHSIPSNEVCELSSQLIATHHFHQHYQAGVQVYPYKAGIHADKLSSYDKNWFLSMRHKAHKVIKKYVRIKPHVIEKVERFYNSYLYHDRVLGIHVRATDKQAHIGGRQILSEEYFPHIDNYFRKYPGARLFCATDSPRELEKIKNRYPEKSWYYDSLRDERNIFKVATSDNYKKGEDALIDSLLLSKCDFLMKSSSAVSEFSVYFNPELHDACIDLQFHDSYG